MTNTTLRPARAALTALCLALLLCAAAPACATGLDLPQGARLTLETTTGSGSYRLPTGPWHDSEGVAVTRIEGAITRQAWRIDSQSATTLQLLAPLRDQLVAAGFEIVFECAARACGGFDFRFATEILPGPDMYVNLTDFRFLSAVGPDPKTAAMSLLVSRSSTASFIQVIEVRADRQVRPAAGGTTPTVRSGDPTDLVQRLESSGHVVLRDLQFESGSSGLGDGKVASLDRIATYLAANPARRMVFVGHTDATGSLEANIALSRRRAMAAVDYLVTRHDTARSQVSADGVGFLSPLSTNLTDAGRLLNRRVEAVLIGPD